MMKPGGKAARARKNGHTAVSGIKLKRKEQESLREIQQVWVGIALDVINGHRSAPLALSVTSTAPGEGKTTNCLGLAAALSREIEGDILVIEADITCPGMAEQLHLKEGPGLVDYLAGQAPLGDLLQHTAVPNVDVIVAGTAEQEDGEASADVTEFWDNPTWSRLRRTLPSVLARLKESYAYIIMEMPPVETHVYTRDLAQVTDGTYLTVRSGMAHIEEVKRAVDEIGQDKLAGVILAGASSPVPGWLSSILIE